MLRRERDRRRVDVDPSGGALHLSRNDRIERRHSPVKAKKRTPANGAIRGSNRQQAANGGISLQDRFGVV